MLTNLIPVSIAILSSVLVGLVIRQYRRVQIRDRVRRRIQTYSNPTPPSNFSYDPLDHSLYWYPVALSTEVKRGPGKPFGFTLLNQPLCLYRRNDGEVICVLDLCPHRSAPLSLGQVTREGNLECVYHGWQYASNGQCVLIPSVSKSSKTASLVCARTLPVHEQYGFIWVWPGKRELAHSDLIPHRLFNDIQDEKGSYILSPEYGCSLDIPYELMVDNLLDNAHIYFIHDGTIAQRSEACWMRSERIVPSPYLPINGESVSFHVTRHELPKPSAVEYSDFHFIPPCFVRLNHRYRGDDRWFVQIFFILPSAENQMRLLTHFYRNFARFKWFEYIPSYDYWVARLVQKVVDQDVFPLRGVQRNLQGMGAKVFGTTVSADEPIRAFRRFHTRTLAKHGTIYCPTKPWSNLKETKMNETSSDPTDIEEMKID